MNSSAANVSICRCEIYNESYTPAYEWTNFILIIIFLPIIASTGFICNILNFIVFKNLSNFSVMNVYLSMLAVSDACVCISGILILTLDSLKGYILNLSGAFVIIQVQMLPVAFMVQTCSIYITMAATLYGFIEVYCVSRKMRRKFLSYKRSVQVIVLLVLFSISYNAIRFAEFRAEFCWHAERREFRREICPTDVYLTIRYVYDVLLYTIVMTVLPFFVILVLSALIIRRTHLHERLKHIFYFPSLRSHVSTIMAAGGFKVEPQKTVDPDQTQAALRDERIMTLIMLVCLFVVCNVIAVVATVVLSAITELDAMSIDTVTLHFITDFSNFLVVLNSAANFLIYAGCNSQFRNELHNLLVRSRRYIPCLRPWFVYNKPYPDVAYNSIVPYKSWSAQLPLALAKTQEQQPLDTSSVLIERDANHNTIVNESGATNSLGSINIAGGTSLQLSSDNPVSKAPDYTELNGCIQTHSNKEDGKIKLRTITTEHGVVFYMFEETL